MRMAYIVDRRLPDDHWGRIYQKWLLMEKYEERLFLTKNTSLMIESYHHFISILATDVTDNINDLIF